MAGFTPLGDLPQKTSGDTVEPDKDIKDIPTTTDLLKGVASATTTLATGMAVTPLAGLYAAFQGMYNKDTDPYMEGAAETLKHVQDEYIWTPGEGGVGETILKTLAIPFEGLDNIALSAGDATIEATGNPEAATAAYTAVNSLPDLLGIKLKPKGTGANIVKRGQELKNTSKGDSIANVQAAVNSARKHDYDHATSLFEEIKDLPPNYIDKRDIQGLPGTIRKTIQDKTSMTGITLDDMPSVKAVLNDLDNLKTIDRKSRKGAPTLSEIEPSSRTPKRDMGIEPHVVLSDLMEIRKQATGNYTPKLAKNKPSEHLALGLAIKQIDNHIDSLFNSDMVSGAATSIDKWKNARGVWADYKKRFDENKVISDMADAEATPEQVVNWVYGASELSLKPEAASTVKRIKDIIGKDSEAFHSLQNEYLFKILSPLLEDVPKLDTFVKRYNNQIKNNSGLIDELGIDTKELDRLAKSAQKYSVTAKDMGKSFNLDRSAAIILLSSLKGGSANAGMAFAKSALQINLLTRVFESLRNIKNIRKKKDILVDFLNYDAYTPLINKRASRAGSIGETVRSEERLREEKPQDNKSSAEKVILKPSGFQSL